MELSCSWNAHDQNVLARRVQSRVRQTPSLIWGHAATGKGSRGGRQGIPVGPLLPERAHRSNHNRNYGRCSLDGRSRTNRDALP